MEASAASKDRSGKGLAPAPKPANVPVFELPDPARETYVDGALTMGFDGANIMITFTTGRSTSDQPGTTMVRTITARLIMPMRLLAELSGKAQAMIHATQQARAAQSAASERPQ